MFEVETPRRSPDPPPALDLSRTPVTENDLDDPIDSRCVRWMAVVQPVPDCSSQQRQLCGLGPGHVCDVDLTSQSIEQIALLGDNARGSSDDRCNIAFKDLIQQRNDLGTNSVASVDRQSVRRIHDRNVTKQRADRLGLFSPQLQDRPPLRPNPRQGVDAAAPAQLEQDSFELIIERVTCQRACRQGRVPGSPRSCFDVAVRRHSDGHNLDRHSQSGAQVADCRSLSGGLNSATQAVVDMHNPDRQSRRDRQDR